LSTAILKDNDLDEVSGAADNARAFVTIAWERIGRSKLLDVAAAVLTVCALVRLVGMLPARANQDDFAHYYVASRLLIDGGDPYRTMLRPFYAQYGLLPSEEFPPFPAPNPPPFLWVFEPFARLAPQHAFWAWAGAQAVCLGVILWRTRQLLGARLSSRAWRFVCAAALSSATVYWHFYYSQMGLLLAALVLTSYAWQRNGRPLSACLAVATAGLLKLFPFVLLPWFMWRGKGTARQRAAQIGVTTAFVAAIVFATGTQRWANFVRYSMPRMPAQSVNQSFNYTLPSFITNLGYAASDFRPSAEATRVWTTLGIAAGLALIALSYSQCLRATQDLEAEFCVLCVAMLAGSMRSWGHYFVFLIFPMGVMAAQVVGRATARRSMLLGVVFVLLNLQATWQNAFLNQHMYLKILVNYLPFYGLIVLGLFLARSRNEPKALQPDTELVLRS
jgi:Glycosyltransferase family 87